MEIHWSVSLCKDKLLKKKRNAQMGKQLLKGDSDLGFGGGLQVKNRLQ